MATFNGERFLAGQLDSIAGQSHTRWTLWASDDGSRDATRQILEAYRAQWGADRLRIHDGPRAGFAANFLSLACHDGIEADCFAYADQDDIWLPCKLERALSWLDTVPAGVPALYCSRTLIVDADDRLLGVSAPLARPPGFGNALVQSIAGGNTMVFNRTARDLLRTAGTGVKVRSHDQWAYIVITGCGGRMHLDHEPTVRYRQHGANAIGHRTGLTRIRGRWRALRGRARLANEGLIAGLQAIRSLLTPQSRDTLDHFARLRHAPLAERIASLRRSGMYAQSRLDSLGLLLAAALRRL